MAFPESLALSGDRLASGPGPPWLPSIILTRSFGPLSVFDGLPAASAEAAIAWRRRRWSSLGEVRHEAQDRRLPDHRCRQLLKLALKRSGATKSDIVNDALSRFLDPPPEKDPRGDVLRRLDGLAKGIRRIHRDVEIAAETLALHIRQFLMITPPVPKVDQEEAMRLGRERYEVFIEQIAKRVASDNGMVEEIMEKIAETHGDRFRQPTGNGAARPGTARPSETAAHG